MDFPALMPNSAWNSSGTGFLGLKELALNPGGCVDDQRRIPVGFKSVRPAAVRLAHVPGDFIVAAFVTGNRILLFFHFAAILANN
jgi:hypothetical protein